MDLQPHEDQQRSRTYSAPNRVPHHAQSFFEDPVFSSGTEGATYSQQTMDIDLAGRSCQVDDQSWPLDLRSSDLNSGQSMLPISGWPPHSINQYPNAEAWNPLWVNPQVSFSAGIPVTPCPDTRSLSPTYTIDSGYGSQPMRPQPSTVRSCPAEMDPRLTVPLSDAFSPTQSESQSRRGRGKRHQRSRAPSSVRSSRADQDLPPCPDCLAIGFEKRPKNKSEQKKHEKVHTKPFQCHSCSRGMEKKFATWNDLERHQRAKHGVAPKHGSCKYYKCTWPNCSKADKLWERKDNFKAHFERTHKGSPKQALDTWVANSEYQPTEEEMLDHWRQKEKRRPQDAPRSNSSANEQTFTDKASQSDYQDNTTSQSVPSEDPLSQGELLLSAGVMCGKEAFKDWRDETSELPYLFLGPEEDELTANMLRAKDEREAPALMGLGSTSNRATPIPTVADDFCHLKIGSMVHQPTDKRAWSMLSNDNQVEAEQSCPAANGSCSNWAPEDKMKRTKSDITGPSPDATFKCPDCAKTKQRSCDLTKHMKRHTKPYGCTFPKCRKRFGSKNDWKRHESSQHKQQEMWRCNSEPCKGSQPARLFYDKSFSEEHLVKDHACGSDQRACYVSAFKLSKDYHETFWCGFCKEIIAQDPKKETPADSGRFQHIGKHFDDEQDSSTENWLCFEMNRPKRDVSDPPGKPKAPKSERSAGSPPKAKQEGCLTSMLAGPRKRPNSESETHHGASSKKHCRDFESISQDLAI